MELLLAAEIAGHYRSYQVLGPLQERLRPGDQVLQAMGKTTPVDAGQQLGNVRCPVLVVQGSADPDWAAPRADGEAIIADLPTGLGRLEMVDGAGHYPHVQFPAQVATAMLTFLAGVHA